MAGLGEHSFEDFFFLFNHIFTEEQQFRKVGKEYEINLYKKNSKYRGPTPFCLPGNVPNNF